MENVLALCDDLPEEAFAPGQQLMAEGGEPDGRIYVLVDGTVEVSRGGVLIVRLSEPGVFLGEMSALLGAPHSAQVVAATQVHVRVLDDAGRMFGSEAGLLLEMAKLLARRLNAVTAYLVDIQRQYADQGGHLGLMHQVLQDLLDVRPTGFVPGSAREDVPGY